MRIAVLETRVYKGNQRATKSDAEKIAIVAKTGDLGGLGEMEDATEMSGM
jgi:hypothetical protein